MTEQTKGAPWGDAPDIVLRLSRSLDSFDWTAAEGVCSELIRRLNDATAPFPADPAKQILYRLRRKRRFGLMALVSDALIRSGQAGPQIRRQYAQAMIDQGNLSASEIVLNSIIADPQSPVSEKSEARGLLGRIYKQLYVNANDARSPRQQNGLGKAIEYYGEVYRSDPKEYTWQGINTVALLARARRDDLQLNTDWNTEETAQHIFDDITAKNNIQYWDRATLVEASVALNRLDDARDHLIYFVADPQVDAFEVGSLLRQLKEVWGLTPRAEPGASLLPILHAASLIREGGEMTLDRDDLQGGLEAVFGQDRYEPLKWLQDALKRCQAVARIETQMGRRLGSGFLVEARDFFQNPPPEPLLLTNAHVISPRDKPQLQSIAPEVAVAVFEATGQRAQVTSLVWTSPVDALDATFVTLAKLERDCLPCPLKPPPEPFDRKKTQRVYVIGYPLGGGLSISLQDSTWLDTDAKVLHYRTPTEQGSSGSPVFDQNYWSVLALHHKGKSDLPRLNGLSGTYEANEGVAIAAIQKAVQAPSQGASRP